MKNKSEPDILKVTENVYRTFFENSLDAILITTENGSIHEANPAACKMLGWSKDALLKIGRNEIAEQTQRLSEALRQRKEKRKFFGELNFIRKDGTIFPVEISSTFFTNPDGREFLIIIARDITVRKETERALKESEEHLRLAGKAAGFGSFSYEFDTGKAYYSDGFLLLYGLSPSDTIELDQDLVPAALHHDDKSRFLTSMQRANNPGGDGIMDLEYRIINTNGSTRWLRTRGLTVFSGKNSDARPLHANGIIQDITARKEQEEKFSELSERCRLITEYSGLGVGYYTIEGKILLFNEEAMKNLGGKTDDYLGKNVTEVFGKRMGKIYINRFKKTAHSEIPIQYEDYVGLDGKPGWYLSTHTRILNKNGVLDGIHVIAENITERKLAELEHIQNEEQLNLIFSTMSEGVALNEVILDETGRMVDYRILQVNDAFYRIADYKKNIRIIGNTATEIYGMSYESITDFWKTHQYSNETVNTEYLSPLNNIWYGISTSPFKGNKFVTTFRDITGRKIAEEKLRTSALYSRTLIEASLDPFIIINSEGKITDVNLATEKITGIRRNMLIGSDFASFIMETGKAGKVYDIAFSKGEVKNYHLKIRHKSGSLTDVLYNATVFRNEKGFVDGVLVVARDITQREKMESKLRDSKKHLEMLNQHVNDIRENERSEIALNLHDDLGQRLTGLFLDVAWIKSRIGVQSPTVRSRLDEMSQTINETIDSIREISYFLRPTILYDLGVVPAIFSQLNKFEKHTGIKCNFHFDSEEFNIDDKISLALFRIIQESLTNIMRHSQASAMSVSLKKMKKNIEMIIEDNGVGIDEDKVSSLTSMGLEGIRERAKSASGEVIISGEKGKGTRIFVTIPYKSKPI